MDSRELIDAQFDRAVEIVQNFPKTGPIQTGYEEKLTMYRSTAGNVKSPRPGMWDMLGRAKWDAWAKHKDLDSYEAKWLYVDALLKVLRKYSDKTVARDLVRELESYGGDPANLVHSGMPSPVSTLSNRLIQGVGTFSRSPDSDSSSSDGQDPGAVYRSAQVLHHARDDLGDLRESSASEEETTDDETTDLGAPEQTPALNRPQSSLSSHRYGTPGASSTLLSTPAVPTSQPQGLETLSAFGGSVSTSYPRPSAEQAVPRDTASLPSRSTYPGIPHRPPSRIALERAIEIVQTQLAALSERIELIELHSSNTRLASPPGPSRSSPTFAGRRSPSGSRDVTRWDFDEMGLWAIVFKGITRVLASLRQFAIFLSDSEGRSPTFVVVRRLFLDLSFIICALALIKTVWRRTGVRRREVSTAIRALWWAVLGKAPARSMADRGI
ncbi:ACBP-domain-containing protein [Lactarius akahatsu]|uniref:ACBP-domain-containing protein n=1 Tax=Lactarius akahatsu TaxID=416441 RepID=A0AAD4QC20_9AGAM|nr:ACBP-domain-containing protein [Lactarius akahatsu]